MRVNHLNKWVTLSRAPQETDDNDGFFEPLNPPGVWAAIEPLAPIGDGRTVQSLVTLRYHPQVSMDTRILYGTRELFVKGFQNVTERNVELRCLCEEVVQ
jgi:head-tail adaptor